MAVQTSGTITQASSGSPLTFLDTSSGLGTVSSRTLTIFDGNGMQLAFIVMGASLTANFPITADGYFTFFEQIVDNTGTYTLTINYLSTAFYDITFVNTMAQLGCGCSLEQFNYIDISQLFKAAAIRLFIGGLGASSQQAITAANQYITGT